MLSSQESTSVDYRMNFTGIKLYRDTAPSATQRWLLFEGHHMRLWRKREQDRTFSIRMRSLMVRLSTRETFFPRDYQIRTRRDLCLDYYCRKGWRVVLNNLLLRKLDSNLDRRRADRFARTLRGHRSRLNAIQPACFTVA